MKIIGMIPARGGSSRFNMKPLALICGKPMVYWVWKHSKEVACFEEVYVATDNEEIKSVAEGFGAKVLMTSPDCDTATERLYEVSAGKQRLGLAEDPYVMEPIKEDYLASGADEHTAAAYLSEAITTRPVLSMTDTRIPS